MVNEFGATGARVGSVHAAAAAAAAAAAEPGGGRGLPDGAHRGARPAEYERRVVAFFDGALLS